MVDVGVMQGESRPFGFEVVGSAGGCFFEVELGRGVGRDAGVAVVDPATDGCCVVPEGEEDCSILSFQAGVICLIMGSETDCEGRSGWKGCE